MIARRLDFAGANQMTSDECCVLPSLSLAAQPNQRADVLVMVGFGIILRAVVAMEQILCRSALIFVVENAWAVVLVALGGFCEL